MKIYLVGGAVRDTLLDISVFDHDWVVVGATPEELLSIGYKQIGKDFPVFLHPETHEQYALARTERKSGQGYTGFTCCVSPDVTLEEDLLRRDLTINAIACSSEGVLVDPYKGVSDLQAHVLRHVSNAFSEDPLRVLRVARFASRFAYLGFSIAQETLELMRCIAHSGELADLTAERVWQETSKALMSQHPQVYFQILRKCDALAVLFPEIDALFGSIAPGKWQSKIDIGHHTMMTLAISAGLSSELEVRFAALCNSLGKGLTTQNYTLNHYEHDLARIKLVEELCQRFRIPSSVRNLAKLSAEYHNIFHIANKLKPKKLLKLFDDIDAWRNPHRLRQIILTSAADIFAQANHQSNKYPQGDYLHQAYQVAKAVSIEEILTGDLHGLKIRDEIKYRREQALLDWQRTQNIISH